MAEVQVEGEAWVKAGVWVLEVGWEEVLAGVGVEDKRKNGNS